MLTADQTVPGKVYKTSRVGPLGPLVWYTRPKTTKRTNPTALAAAMVIRRDSQGHAWTRKLKADPTLVLLEEHQRGEDFISATKWEVSRYVLVPADYRLREVKRAP